MGSVDANSVPSRKRPHPPAAVFCNSNLWRNTEQPFPPCRPPHGSVSCVCAGVWPVPFMLLKASCHIKKEEIFSPSVRLHHAVLAMGQ